GLQHHVREYLQAVLSVVCCLCATALSHSGGIQCAPPYRLPGRAFAGYMVPFPPPDGLDDLAAYGATASARANAYTTSSSYGWECEGGYRTDGEACTRVPPNAYLAPFWSGVDLQARISQALGDVRRRRCAAVRPRGRRRRRLDPIGADIARAAAIRAWPLPSLRMDTCPTRSMARLAMRLRLSFVREHVRRHRDAPACIPHGFHLQTGLEMRPPPLGWSRSSV